ncbi:hypothetical protein AO825_15530 [Pectobacterium brasiliense]|nr:hypothetical protein AO825_15530 [Pectobacterium brasiliense]
MFCSTVNGRMGIVMNVVMTKAGILRHVGQLTSKNYAISVKASRGGTHRVVKKSASLWGKRKCCVPDYLT